MKQSYYNFKTTEHLSSEIRPGAQKITIIPKADGQIEIHGLQESNFID